MSNPQSVAFRAMSPRSRLLQLAQWGLNKMDWEELLAMGESAKMEETNGGDLAARIGRWKAVATFVNGYSGIALTFGVLDFFFYEEHEMWCGQVNNQISQRIGEGILTHSQQRRFEEQHDSLVGGHRVAEGWLRDMVSRVSGRLEMLASCLESASGATG